MKRINSVTDALNTNKVLVDAGDGIVIPLPADGVFAGAQGAPGVGVPDGGDSGQVIQKTASGTRWATPSKELVGLTKVDNTADSEKPLSEPQALALTNKADLIGGKVPSSQLPEITPLTDSTIAPLINGATTGAAIDARINTQVAPQVQKITADFIAGDRAVVDAAAAAVDANPKIISLESKNTSQDAAIAQNTVWVGALGSGSDLNTAVGVAKRISLYEVGNYGSGIANMPPNPYQGQLEVVRNGNGRRMVQRMTYDRAGGEVHVRYGMDSTGAGAWTFTPWSRSLTTELDGTWSGVITTGGDLNAAVGKKQRVSLYEIGNYGSGIANMPPNPYQGHLEVVSNDNGRRIIQRVTYANDTAEVWRRQGTDSNGTNSWVFTSWKRDGGGPSAPVATEFQGIRVFSPMNAGHGWTGGPTANATYNLNDTSRRVTGDRSITMTTDGTGSGNSYLQLAGLNLDLTNKGLTFWVQATNQESILSVDLSVSSGNPTTLDAGVFPYVFVHLPLSPGGKSPMQEGEWIPIHVSLGNATGSNGGVFDRTSVKTLRVAMRQNPGMPAPTLRIGGVGTFGDATPRYPKGVISIMFDDTYDSDYLLAAPRLARHGLPATAYTIYSRVGTAGCTSMQQLRELSEVYGWEIAAHATDDAAHTDWRDKSPELFRAELKAQKEWQEANNFPTETFAYPYGPFNAEMARQAANYYTSARSTYGWVNSAAHPMAHRLTTRVISPTTTAESVVEYINRAKIGGGWLCLMFHRVEDKATSSNGTTVADLDTILAAVVASGLPVDTVGNVIRNAG